MFTAGLGTDYFTDANALKSKGTGNSNMVLILMSVEYSCVLKFQAVKAAWIKEQGKPTPVAPVTEKETDGRNHDGKRNHDGRT